MIWKEAVLNASATADIMEESDLAIDYEGNIYYVGTDARIHQYYLDRNFVWKNKVLNSIAPRNVRTKENLGTVALSPLTCDPSGFIYFVASDDRIHNYWKSGSNWQEATLNNSAPYNVRTNTDIVSDNMGKIHFIAKDNRVHQYYWAGNYWLETVNNINDPQNVLTSLATDGTNIFYVGYDWRVWSSYAGCNNLFKNQVEINNVESLNKNENTNGVLSPNPNNGIFTIQLEGWVENPITLDLYDITGRLIWNKSIIPLNNISSINCNLINFNEGLYILKVSNKTVVRTLKVIKQ